MSNNYYSQQFSATDLTTRARASDIEAIDAAVESAFDMVQAIITTASFTAATSSSSVTIGTGSKSFTVASGLNLPVGMNLQIAQTSNPTVNSMHAVVTSYSGTALVVTVDSINGSGTITDWTITLGAPAGATLSANTFTGTQTMSGAAHNEAKGANIASAVSPDIWAATGNTIHITGTVAITSFPAAPQAGVWRRLIFDDAVLLTSGANFVVIGGDYTTAANDIVDVFANTTTQFYLYPRLARRITRVARTSNTQLVEKNRGQWIDITSGTFAQTFAAAASLGDGWYVEIRNSGTGTITLTPDGAETIDGSSTVTVRRNEYRKVYCDGSALYTVGADLDLGLISSTPITPSAASVSIAMPTGYIEQTLDLYGAYFSAAGAFLLEKNGLTASLNDFTYRTITNAPVSGNQNCASITAAAPDVTFRRNMSAISSEEKIGSSQINAGYATIRVRNLTAATYQRIGMDVTVHPIGATATVPSALHNFILATIDAVCKDTAKMTALSVVAEAGKTFQGGTIVLRGKKR